MKGDLIARRIGMKMGSRRIGIFFSEAYLSGTMMGLPASMKQDDSALGTTVLAGLDVRLAENWSLGAEYRKIFLKSNFGVLSYHEDVDVGGDSLMLVVRWYTPLTSASH